MSNQSNTFKLGAITLSSPIVIASSPATEDVERLRRCSDAGAGAAILKSCHGIKTNPTDEGKRRFRITPRGLWGTSTTGRELLHPQTARKIIENMRTCSDMPVIPSIALSTLDSEEWIETLLYFEAYDVSCAQLDLFYLDEEIALPETQVRLRELVLKIVGETKIDLIPKMNVELRPASALRALNDTGIAGWSMIDSIRVAFPQNSYNVAPDFPDFSHAKGLRGASLFGSWQFPLTCDYLQQLRSKTDLPILAGGGVTNAHDLRYLLAMGANAVQVATPLLYEGPQWIRRVHDSLNETSEVMRLAQEDTMSFQNATASIDTIRCSSCGECLNQLMCTAIREGSPTPFILEEACEGCGFCVDLCPAGAISLNASFSSN